MKVRWQKKKIADIIEPLNTVDPRQNPDSYFTYIDVSSTSRTTFEIEETAETKGELAPSRARRRVQTDDIIYATIRPTLQRVAQVPKSLDGAICSTGYFVIRAKPEILPRFMFYSLLAPEFSGAMASLQRGASYPAVSDSDVKRQQLTVPPLDEQKRIVAILDRAFAGINKAIANTEKNLANARELFENYLNTAFNTPDKGGRRLALKDVCTDYGRGKSKHRPRNDPKLYDGKYPFIQTGDVRNSDHFIMSYSTTYNDAGLAQSKFWPKGTICITIAANIAETGVLMFDACFPDSVIGLVPDPQLASSSYIEFLLQSFKTSIQAQGKGSAQANINLGTFEDLRFPFPDVEAQQQVVAKLHKLREQSLALESVHKRKLTALANLKQSLLHKAFTGELTAASEQEMEAAMS